MDIQGHSLDIDFLKEELSTSLKRLNLNCLDFFLIQHPEQSFLRMKNKQNAFKILEGVFRWLESEVDNGRIKHYGISSYAMTLPSDNQYFFSFEKCVETAKKLEGDNHHFSLIQVPFNIHEHDYLTQLNYENNTLSLSDAAKKEGIATVTFSPFRSKIGQRFIQYPDHQGLIL